MQIRISTVAAAIIAAVIPASGAIAGHTNQLLVTKLDGREVVDPANPGRRLAGDPDGMGEAYVFGIDGDPATLCYILTVEDIQLVPVGSGMMAHIHAGARDAAGPVVAALAGPEDGNAADCLTEGEMGKFPTGEAGIVQKILNNPEQYYVNVHNPEYPDGVIRGQLGAQMSHSQDDGDDDDDDGMAAGGAPSVPTGLAATAYSASAVEVTWARSTDDGRVLAYEVFQNGTSVGEVPGPSYFTDELSSGTAYEFEVEAIDNDGNSSDRSEGVIVTTR